MAFPTQSLGLASASSQYASIADASQTGLDFSDVVTLEGWFKFTTLPDNFQTPLIIKREGAGNQRSWFWAVDKTAGVVTINFLWYTDGSTVGGNLFSDTWTPSTTTWYHLAVTKNGTTVKFYVDGVQFGATKTGSNGTIYNGTAAVEVGSFLAAPDYYNGRMVELRAWSTERTESEINTNKCTTLGATTGLQAEWTFDNVYTDNSGNSNTLTPSGSPTFAADTPATCSAPAGGGRDARALTLLAVG